MAASMDRWRCVEVLLKRGATVNATAKNGMTPLHYACRGVNISKTGVLLIQAGADRSLRDANGASPVDYALTSGEDTELVQFLRKPSN